MAFHLLEISSVYFSLHEIVVIAMRDTIILMTSLFANS